MKKFALVCTAAMILLRVPSVVHAQDRASDPVLPVRLTVRIATFSPIDPYAESCGHGSIGLGGKCARVGAGTWPCLGRATWKARGTMLVAAARTPTT